MTTAFPMTTIRKLLILVIFASLTVIQSSALLAQTGHIYWTAEYGGKIQRSNLDGTEATDVLTATFVLPLGIAVDELHSKVYWIDYRLKRIQRSNLDGSQIETLLTSENSMAGIALNPADGFMYFLNGNRLQRAGLDGSNPIELLQLSGPFYTGVFDIALDAAAGKLYLAQAGKILRLNIDGTNLEDLIDPAGATIPKAIVIQPDSNKLYWISTDWKVRSATLDGTDVQEIHTPTVFPRDLVLAPTAGHLFLGTHEGVVRINLDGTEPQQIVPEDYHLLALTVDAGEDKLYWTGPKGIGRSLLNGSEIEQLVSTPFTVPTSIAFDGGARKLFWLDYGANRIQWSNPNGSDLEDVNQAEGAVRGLAVSDGQKYWSEGGNIRKAAYGGGVSEELLAVGAVGEIAIDRAGGLMYWAEWGTGKIRRSNLDGSGATDVITGLTAPHGIAVDPAAGKIYWTDGSDEAVYRADLDGTNQEQLVSGLRTPRGIALDPAAGKMYWASVDGGRIKRANFDGSEVEVLVDGLGGPTGIVLDMASIAAFDSEVPRESAANLEQNYPNPFRDITSVRFSISEPQDIQLEVTDLLGRRVDILASGPHPAGLFMVRWNGQAENGSAIGSGLYILRLTSGGESHSRLMTIVR